MTDHGKTDKSKQREAALKRLAVRPVARADRFVQGGGGMSGQDRSAYYYFLADE